MNGYEKFLLKKQRAEELESINSAINCCESMIASNDSRYDWERRLKGLIKGREELLLQSPKTRSPKAE